MTVFTVNVLVRNFLFGGHAYIGDLEREAQLLAREWVVAIQQHSVTLDLHDVEDLDLAIVTRDGRFLQ